MIVVAPNAFPEKTEDSLPYLFLAGSIEQGQAEDWQLKTTVLMQDKYTILNPRRENWDSSRIDDPSFMDEQVNWELNGIIDQADYVFMYFAPNTKSPISLLELGLILGRKLAYFDSGVRHDQKVVVCCPDGFWRKENVEITCLRAGVPVYDTFDEAIYQLNKFIVKESFFVG